MRPPRNSKHRAVCCLQSLADSQRMGHNSVTRVLTQRRCSTDRYDESLLDCCVKLSTVQEHGIIWSQWTCLARCNGLDVEERIGGTFTIEAFRKDLVSTCEQDSRFLVAAYSRKAVSHAPTPPPLHAHPLRSKTELGRGTNELYVVRGVGETKCRGFLKTERKGKTTS